MIDSAQKLGEYCLRQLGAPVIKINIAPEQIDDRIEEAIQVYRERHYDATEESWLVYQLTQNDVDNGYITLDKEIAVVEEMMPESIISHNGDFMTWQYQATIGAFTNLRQFDMLNYHMTMQNLAQIAEALPSHNRVVHTKHKNRLMFRSPSMLREGETIFLKVFKYIDPEEFTDMYNDKWLKHYSTALIKRQWGNNLKKHEGVVLLGGVTLNGQKIYDEAVEEIDKLEEQLSESYELPTDFFMA